MNNTVVKCEAIDLMSKMANGSVGAVITDPPFHISMTRAEGWRFPRGAGADPWSDVSTLEQVIQWTRPIAKESYRALRKGGALVVMGGTQSLVGWDLCASELGFNWMAEIIVLWNMGKVRGRNFGGLHTRIVWYSKPGLRHSFNWHQRAIYSNVIVCRKVPVMHRHHPAEKPVGLTNFLVSLLTREDDLIVDPFCGSGTTLVSAAQCDRPWAGSDIDPKYVKMARHRANHADSEFPDPVHLWVNGRIEEVGA